MKTAAIAVILIAVAYILTGCVTIGYDFLNQRATVSFDGKSVK